MRQARPRGGLPRGAGEYLVLRDLRRSGMTGVDCRHSQNRDDATTADPEPKRRVREFARFHNSSSVWGLGVFRYAGDLRQAMSPTLKSRSTGLRRARCGDLIEEAICGGLGAARPCGQVRTGYETVTLRSVLY